MSKKVFFVLVVLLVFVSSGTVLAASDLGFKGINLRLAYIHSFEFEQSTFGYGPGIELGSESVRVGSSIFYWNKSYASPDWSMSDFAIKIHLRILSLVEGIKTYAGVGTGLHFMLEKISYSNVSVSTSGKLLGLHFLGGIELPVHEKVGVLVDAEYDFFIGHQGEMIISGGVSLKLN